MSDKYTERIQHHSINILREIDRICRANDIPYFIDEKRPLTANPFMEYLRAALEASVSSSMPGSGCLHLTSLSVRKPTRSARANCRR